jgi:hypothetical protein
MAIAIEVARDELESIRATGRNKVTCDESTFAIA